METTTVGAMVLESGNAREQPGHGAKLYGLNGGS